MTRNPRYPSYLQPVPSDRTPAENAEIAVARNKEKLSQEHAGNREKYRHALERQKHDQTDERGLRRDSPAASAPVSTGKSTEVNRQPDRSRNRPNRLGRRARLALAFGTAVLLVGGTGVAIAKGEEITSAAAEAFTPKEDKTARALGRQMLTGQPVEPVKSEVLTINFDGGPDQRIKRLHSALDVTPDKSTSVKEARNKAELIGGHAAVNGINASDQQRAEYAAGTTAQLDLAAAGFLSALEARAVEGQPIQHVTGPADES